MALQADPIGVRLTKRERAMLAELVDVFGFQSTSDAVRYMLRHEYSALQTALATELSITADRKVAL